MRWFVVPVLCAGLLGGCHLVFPYGDPDVDGAIARDSGQGNDRSPSFEKGVGKDRGKADRKTQPQLDAGGAACEAKDLIFGTSFATLNPAWPFRTPCGANPPGHTLNHCPSVNCLTIHDHYLESSAAKSLKTFTIFFKVRLEKNPSGRVTLVRVGGKLDSDDAFNRGVRLALEFKNGKPTLVAYPGQTSLTVGKPLTSMASNVWHTVTLKATKQGHGSGSQVKWKLNWLVQSGGAASTFETVASPGTLMTNLQFGAFDKACRDGDISYNTLCFNGSD